MKKTLCLLIVTAILAGCHTLSNQNNDCLQPKANVSFKSADCLIEGIASAESTEKQGKLGFVNADGQWVISPDYDYTYNAREGFVIVVKEPENAPSSYQFLRLNGTALNDKSYDSAYSFYDGFARVQQGDLYAYINSKGQAITPFKYEWAEDFTGTFAVVRIGKKWGLIDRTGKEVLPIVYDWVHDGRGQSGAERYLVCKKVSEHSEAKKCGFMDNQLKWVIPMQYDDALHFDRFGVAWVKQGDKEFYIDEHGHAKLLPKMLEKTINLIIK